MSTDRVTRAIQQNIVVNVDNQQQQHQQHQQTACKYQEINTQKDTQPFYQKIPKAANFKSPGKKTKHKPKSNKKKELQEKTAAA